MVSTSAIESPSHPLPTTRALTPVYVLSWAIALVMAAASAAGLIFAGDIYPTQELRQAFVTTDAVNLVIGLPILLISLALAQRGRLVGLLFWPGALFYVLYHYIAYVFGMPFNALFLPYLFLLTASAYTTIALVAAIDPVAVQQRLGGAVPERLAGAVLAGLATAFLLLLAVQMITAVINQTAIVPAQLAVMVADGVTVPAWIVGGILLWRRQALGYVAGLGLLFQGSMLFVGLIMVLLLQPLMTGAPFSPVDVVVVFVMGLIAFVPFVLFLRGVLAGRDSAVRS